MSSGFVRAASTADASAMTTVALASWPQVGDAIETEQMTKQWQELLMHTENATALVATDMDIVVGWVLLLAEDHGMKDEGVGNDETHTTFEIADVVVHPNHRRRGHGSRLMHAAVDVVLTDGGALHAWCPLDDEPRRAFLIAHGLQPDGAWRDLEADSGATIREVRLVARVEARSKDQSGSERTS